MSVVNPCMLRSAQFDSAEEMVNKRGIAGNCNHHTACVFDGNLDWIRLVHNALKRHDDDSDQQYFLEYIEPLRRLSIFSI